MLLFFINKLLYFFLGFLLSGYLLVYLQLFGQQVFPFVQPFLKLQLCLSDFCPENFLLFCICICVFYTFIITNLYVKNGHTQVIIKVLATILQQILTIPFICGQDYPSILLYGICQRNFTLFYFYICSYRFTPEIYPQKLKNE